MCVRAVSCFCAFAVITHVVVAPASVIVPRPDLIAKARVGELAEVHASWWGFDPEDSTAFLQSALSSGMRRIVIDKMESPWISRPLRGASNQTVVFEQGAEIVAKKGEFMNAGDCLLTYFRATNVTLRGSSGSGLRMNRWDYHAAPYPRGEWRHALNLRSCANFTVEGLTFSESGGDGMYLGVDGKSKEPNRNITVRDCHFDQNYRQGISVISADGFLVERTSMNRTKGTWPSAGIDFEPNHPWEVINNCVVRDCVCEGNAGSGIDVALGPLGPTSQPISVSVVNCRFSDNVRGFRFSNAFVGAKYLPRGGLVAMTNCLFSANNMGVQVLNKPLSSVRLEFHDCAIRDSYPVVSLLSRDEPIDGILFNGLTVDLDSARQWITRQDCSWRPSGVRDISGTVTFRDASGKRTLVLDEDWRRSYFGEPSSDVHSVFVPFEPTRVDVHDDAPGETRPLAPFRIRGAANYLFHTDGACKVVFGSRIVSLGHGAKGFSVKAVKDGRKIAEGTLPAPNGEIVVDIQEGGFYQLSVFGRFAFVLSSANVPTALYLPETGQSFIAGGAEGYFHVPRGRRFVFLAEGQGNERCAVRVSSFDGLKMCSDDKISEQRGWVSPQGAEGGMWTLKTSRPSVGKFEDHMIAIRGIQPVLFLDSGRFWSQGK